MCPCVDSHHTGIGKIQEKNQGQVSALGNNICKDSQLASGENLLDWAEYNGRVQVRRLFSSATTDSSTSCPPRMAVLMRPPGMRGRRAERFRISDCAAQTLLLKLTCSMNCLPLLLLACSL